MCSSSRVGTTSAGQKKEKAPERRARKQTNKEIHQQVKYVRWTHPCHPIAQSACGKRASLPVLSLDLDYAARWQGLSRLLI